MRVVQLSVAARVATSARNPWAQRALCWCSCGAVVREAARVLEETLTSSAGSAAGGIAESIAQTLGEDDARDTPFKLDANRKLRADLDRMGKELAPLLAEENHRRGR